MQAISLRNNSVLPASPISLRGGVVRLTKTMSEWRFLLASKAGDPRTKTPRLGQPGKPRRNGMGSSPNAPAGLAVSRGMSDGGPAVSVRGVAPHKTGMAVCEGPGAMACI